MKLLFRFSAIIISVNLLISCNFLKSPETSAVDSEKSNVNSANQQPARNDEPVLISAGGDIMLGSPYPNASRMPPNDGKDLMKLVTPLFQRADIAFANLEGPLIDGGKSAKCGAGSSSCYAFRMPTRYAAYLKEAGLDVLCLANNHANDFGDIGRETTRKTLDALGIKHAGSDREQYAMTFVESKGKKVAFIGFGHNAIVPNINDLDFARGLVEKADKEADLVIVTFHGGAEGSANARVPQRKELFLGEERGNLPAFARTVIDAGADAVIGHGPHVLRGMEIYKDRLIAYSLGNFVTYGWFPLAGATAETLVLDFTLAPDGKFTGGKINPFILRDRGILSPDTNNSVVQTIKKLSKADFPNSMPKISDDGVISP